jgi:hypothetical protein
MSAIAQIFKAGQPSCLPRPGEAMEWFKSSGEWKDVFESG